jgi:glycosyltransferase involved in cell wall biosynthesis
LGQGLDIFIFPNINFYSLSADIKKILIVHDLSFEIFPKFYSPKGRLWHWMINARTCCQEADKIIAVSQNTKNDLINLFKLPPKKISVIYPGLSEKFTRAEDWQELKRIKQKYSLPDNFIFYLGTLEPRKNLIALIKAFEKLKQKTDLPHKLVLAGAKGHDSEKNLQAFNKSSFANQMKYIGYVTAEEKPALYSLADLFVYPSFYEGFGFPPLEALACGTPTLTSSAGSLGEVLGAYTPILANPYNVNELALGMKKLLQSQKFKKHFLENADQIQKRYSWSETAKEFLNLIKL